MGEAWQPGQLLFAGFDGTEVPDDLADLVSAGRVGGVVLFARNVADPVQLRALTDALHALAPEDAPLTIAIDQEGGRVQRCRAPWTEWPPMECLGRGSVEDTAEVAACLARELADLRIDLDFAPCVDVATCPDNPVIGDRSFSSDPAEVARHAVAFIEALQAGGVAACAKHFPGHGDTALDSHFALPKLDHDLERLRRVELPPFRASVDAGVASVMTAHILLPRVDRERPVTLSAPGLALLRDELGYDGLVFTDDLEMAAVADRYTAETLAREALESGADVLLACRSVELRDRLLTALESAPADLLERPLARLAALKGSFSGGRRATGGGPPYPRHRELATRLA